MLRESTLNKIGAFSLNPRLKLMLGQQENHLDFREIMDEGKVLLLDLGHCDSKTNRLISSLVVTGLELAMRRRRNRKLWNLTIDEFAGYVDTEAIKRDAKAETQHEVFSLLPEKCANQHRKRGNPAHSNRAQTGGTDPATVTIAKHKITPAPSGSDSF